MAHSSDAMTHGIDGEMANDACAIETAMPTGDLVEEGVDVCARTGVDAQECIPRDIMPTQLESPHEMQTMPTLTVAKKLPPAHRRKFFTALECEERSHAYCQDILNTIQNKQTQFERGLEIRLNDFQYKIEQVLSDSLRSDVDRRHQEINLPQAQHDHGEPISHAENASGGAHGRCTPPNICCDNLLARVTAITAHANATSSINIASGMDKWQQVTNERLSAFEANVNEQIRKMEDTSIELIKQTFKDSMHSWELTCNQMISALVQKLGDSTASMLNEKFSQIQTISDTLGLQLDLLQEKKIEGRMENSEAKIRISSEQTSESGIADALEAQYVYIEEDPNSQMEQNVTLETPRNKPTDNVAADELDDTCAEPHEPIELILTEDILGTNVGQTQEYSPGQRMDFLLEQSSSQPEEVNMEDLLAISQYVLLTDIAIDSPANGDEVLELTSPTAEAPTQEMPSLAGSPKLDDLSYFAIRKTSARCSTPRPVGLTSGLPTPAPSEQCFSSDLSLQHSPDSTADLSMSLGVDPALLHDPTLLGREPPDAQEIVIDDSCHEYVPPFQSPLPSEPPEVRERPYGCTFCSRRYSHSNSLRKHIRKFHDQSDPMQTHVRSMVASSSEPSATQSISSRKSRIKRKKHANNNSSASGRGANKKRPRPAAIPESFQHHASSPSTALESSECSITVRDGTPEDCNWPCKSFVSDGHDRQIVICDRCEAQYHFRCVGIKKSDLRLLDSANYFCPPCCALGVDLYIPCPSPMSLRHCRRPDCDWPGVPEKAEDFFTIDRIIGRMVCDDHEKLDSPTFLWLVKWDGYSASKSDWMPASGMNDAHTLIRQFRKDAETEDLNWQASGTILLREAIEHGWGGISCALRT